MFRFFLTADGYELVMIKITLLGFDTMKMNE